MRSVCTSRLAVDGVALVSESTLILGSTVRLSFIAGALAAIVGGVTLLVGRVGAAAFESVSSVTNCNAVCGTVRSSGAAGSTLGQDTREFMVSARCVRP